MNSISVSNSIIMDSDISNHAFYLYVALKGRCDWKTGKLTVYSFDLLEDLQWKSKKTLKKYLQELKYHKIVDFDFENFPINRALKIKILKVEESDFTMVEKNIIKDLISQSQSVHVKWTEKGEKVENDYDLKENALRLYYYYVKCYNPDIGGGYPGYTSIYRYARISSRYVKAINTFFEEKGFVKVIIGKRHNDSNRRASNTYIPISCTREKEENNA